MDLKVVLLTSAYTIGLTSLVLQFICFLKKIEFKETLFLTASFLLLILAVAFSENRAIIINNGSKISDFLIYFFTLLLGFALTLNIHTEKIVRFASLRNKLFFTLTLIIFLIMTIGFFKGFSRYSKILVLVYFNALLIYTMIINIKAKSNLLLKHREKEEKFVSAIILIFVVVYSSLGLLNYYFEIWSFSLFQGTLFLPFFLIILGVSKISDDLQRLGMFNSKRERDSKDLSAFQISKREQEVVSLLVKGLSYKAISEQLFISLPTVKTHVSSIYQKLEINNKVELINFLNQLKNTE